MRVVPAFLLPFFRDRIRLWANGTETENKEARYAKEQETSRI